MHHSTDPKLRAIILAHYIDDSGTHDQSPLVVMGGPVFLQRDFSAFHLEWDRILSLHKVVGPIHMKEFGKDGRLGTLTYDLRRSLFSDLVHLINSRKAYSLTVEVDHPTFQAAFPPAKFKRLLTAPSIGLYHCMVLDSLMGKNNPRVSKIAYVIAKSDCGTELVECHSFFQSWEEREQEEQFVGSLTFDTPKNVNALQAADMVAWANLRKGLNKPFDKGFEPLELLTRTLYPKIRPAIIHAHYTAKDAGTISLSKIVGDPVRVRGKRATVLKRLPPKDKPDGKK
jgi:Protein of unknown function (DUF3800)